MPAGAGVSAESRGPAEARSSRTARSLPFALVCACRPRQWLKNLLVFAAPAAAGALGQPSALASCAVAFVLFCLAAGGTYLLNDVRDVERDRAHERKRDRPVASGDLPVPVAVTVGVVLVAAVPPASLLFHEPGLTVLLTCYVVLTLAYTHFLKDVVVCDLVAVSACHVLRAVAGAVVVGVPLTTWFVIVVSLAALLVVVGKREAELRAADAATDAAPAGSRTSEPLAARATLRGYSVSYLTQTRTTVSAAMIVTYCVWALEPAEHTTFHAVSIVPFIMFVLRYNLLVDRGVGEEPEEVALRDRPLQAVLVALVTLVGLGIYL
ncbi:decaprenyl-phosphate phosphoribosyltransferase [Nocardiopsis aegyptia]|uniref:Decaprenyl-phosphate phosphoribosyltransferase n=1 Tax=Nocardiopsis aegyptia TaxID=220378 RepID=A0A7Z0EL33_9ACTN|nr:decaprenyl-phosphate phosphoribosyltransferase [Nocardiopsis aegyptia]